MKKTIATAVSALCWLFLAYSFVCLMASTHGREFTLWHPRLLFTVGVVALGIASARYADSAGCGKCKNLTAERDELKAALLELKP